MALAQQRRRPHDVGVSLARHQMTHRHQLRRVGAVSVRARRRQVGPEVDDADVARTQLGAALGRARAVGQDQPGVRQGSGHGAPAALAGPGHAQHVAAVRRHHQRGVGRRAAHRVPGRQRVVRMHQVEAAWAKTVQSKL